MIVRDLIGCLRVRQWTKNVLIFAALIFSNHANQFPYVVKSFIAFIIFSIGAGAFYTFNDILDLESDREHPVKRQRPIASGHVSVKTGWIFFFTLVFLSLASSIIFCTSPKILSLASCALLNAIEDNRINKVINDK